MLVFNGVTFGVQRDEFILKQCYKYRHFNFTRYGAALSQSSNSLFITH